MSRSAVAFSRVGKSERLPPTTPTRGAPPSAMVGAAIAAAVARAAAAAAGAAAAARAAAAAPAAPRPRPIGGRSPAQCRSRRARLREGVLRIAPEGRQVAHLPALEDLALVVEVEVDIGGSE